LSSDEADATSNDGLCDVSLNSTGAQCTLRAAIEQANANNNPTEVDLINFNISGGGVHTISPDSALPSLSEPVIINGYSQPGTSPNTLVKGTDATLLIELDGTNAGSTGGLVIGAKGSVVRGLVINRFQFSGVNITGDGAGSKVEGNFIGTDPSGTTQDRGNRASGVTLGTTSNNVVGGTTPDKRNLISANVGSGVFIRGFDEVGSGATNNKVQGNLIGTDKNGIANLGNGASGVFIFGGANNAVGGGSGAGANTIAFNGALVGGANGRDGVAVVGANSTGNRFLSNSIFSNEGLGVDLIGPNESVLTDVSTPNDSGDADSGPNTLQNKPVLSSAKTSSTATTIKGTLNSTANKTFVVRFFSNPAGTNEGQTFVGQMNVSTDGSGKASFTKALTKVSVGKAMTATATSPGGDTSEFSAPRTVATS
jgi:hypothetical protein